MKHTLSILVQNRSGELSRVIELISGRGYNIECLTVAETLDPHVSRITLETTADETAVDAIVKRLEKEVRVLEVENLTGHHNVKRQLALIRIRTAISPLLSEVLNIVSQGRAHVLRVGEDSLTLESSGDNAHVNEVIRSLRSVGECEVVRSGAVAMPRVVLPQPEPEPSKG